MKASVRELSLMVLDEYCVLCNVWLAGSAAQHACGDKHVRWSDAIEAVFRGTAPAACVLAAALLQQELETQVRAHYCLYCRKPVGSGFRHTVQHLNSRHHCRQHAHPPLSATSVKNTREPLLTDGLVRDVFCPLCDCVVPTQPERHLLSGRHQQNSKGANSCETLAQAVRTKRDAWCELLQPLHGSICCSCVEYVPAKEIMRHFVSARHKAAHSLASTAQDDVGCLRLFLDAAQQYTSDGYCAVCDATLKSSTTQHTRGKHHAMEMLRAHCDPTKSRELWGERWVAFTRKRQNKCTGTSHKLQTVKMPSPLLYSEHSDVPTGAEVPTNGCLQPALERRSLAEMPFLFFCLNGHCLLCGIDLTPQAIGLVATPVCKDHCRTQGHQRALDDFVSQQGTAGPGDAAAAWAVRWYEAVLHSLRAHPGWHEPAECTGLHTSVDFLEILKDDHRAVVFADALCVTATPTGSV